MERVGAEAVEVIGIRLGVVEDGCDLARLVVEAAESSGVGLVDGDVVVVTSKLVSKCLGSLVDISQITPSRRAEKLARRAGLDARFVELLMRESDDVLLAVPIRELADRGVVDLYSLARDGNAAREVLGRSPTIFVTVRDGEIWTDSGLDNSNHPPNIYSIPPRGLDSVARSVREGVKSLTGRDVAVVICDTEMSWAGSMDVARGSYGIEPIDRRFAEPDLYNKPKFGGVDALVHEICAAAALVMRQTAEGIPIAVVRGLRYERCECGYRDRALLDARRLASAIRLTLMHTVKVLGIWHVLRIVWAVARRR